MNLDASKQLSQYEVIIRQLNNTLSLLKTLRSNVRQIFETLADGFSTAHGSEGRKSESLHLQEDFNTVFTNLCDLESSVNSLSSPPDAFTLNISNAVSVETSIEEQIVQKKLVNSYNWIDKVHKYSSRAHELLVCYLPNRSRNRHKLHMFNKTISLNGNKRRKRITSSVKTPLPLVDSYFDSVTQFYKDMNIIASRPFSENVVVQLSLNRILNAVIAFDGLIVEWIVVKGLGEVLDLWTESRYEVFRKVTENAYAAALNYSSPTTPALSANCFWQWFHSYITLFSAPCQRCRHHLRNALPPTWRDFQTFQPYHEQCKLV